MTDPILAYMPFGRFWGNEVALRYKIEEGYPTGEITFTGLTWETLQIIADWMMGLPPSIYPDFEQAHRALERTLAYEQNRKWGRT